MHEMQSVKMNMREMLKYANLEYSQYRKTGNVVFLQQACEKLFNAFSRYLEIKYNRPTGNHKQLWDLALRDKRNEILFGELGELHRFFYHGVSDDRPAIVYENIYKGSYEKVKTRINNLR